ncbi:MAG TPA: nitrate- and nitrite sensing domain-containing protein [Acidimicrobiia bacterium]
MLSRLSFRAKLLLVLFVPFLALVVIAGAGLRDRFTALRAQEQYGELSGPMQSLDHLSRALENESVVTSWYVSSAGTASATGAPSELRDARSRTDAATKVFRAAEPRFLDAGVSARAIASLHATNDGLDEIAAQRRSIDSLDASAASGRSFFLGVDDDLLSFGERVARDLEDPEASASVGRVFSLQQEQHDLAVEAGILTAVAASGVRADFGPWLSAITSQARERQRFTDGASTAEAHALAAALREPATADALPTAFPSTLPPPSAVVAEYQDDAASLDHAIDRVNGVISAASSERADTAQRDVLLYGGGAVLAMLLTIALIWFAARAVVRPVRRLTDAARDMSQTQLPQLVELLREGKDLSTFEPTRIDVTSEDEIGELAQAFYDVESVTIDVARQQSRLLRKGMGDLFVNLARRNQSLLQRQLELLDELERNEHDPAQLDALFKLDHMATRMRRNAESLLVLSGAEQPRQWQQPITLLDVVRSASAEIADFPRVDLVGVDDELSVSGRAVADLAHLLAELLENATSFSPPDSAVVVSGATTSTGFVLAISDQGIGMPPDKLAEANKLLAKPPVVGLALSRALGLHVVGSLAQRHGITVELRPGAPVGLVALVTLPSVILESQPVAPSSDPAFVPDLGPDGEPVPLGARRVAWRPPDEPPVEEWRAEGLADPEPAHTPPVQTVTLPLPEAVRPDPAVPLRDDALRPDVLEEPRVEEPADVFTPIADEPVSEPDAPLPTRVPGHHLSHQPAVDADDPLRGPEPSLETDPLRPYRVHELLTRHDLGKRRGRAERDGETVDESPRIEMPDVEGQDGR